MRRNLEAPRLRLPDEGQEMPHPSHVTEPEVRELQVDVPGARKAQSSEGLRKLVVVRKVELPTNRQPDGVRGSRDTDAKGCRLAVFCVIEHHSWTFPDRVFPGSSRCLRGMSATKIYGHARMDLGNLRGFPVDGEVRVCADTSSDLVESRRACESAGQQHLTVVVPRWLDVWTTIAPSPDRRRHMVNGRWVRGRACSIA